MSNWKEKISLRNLSSANIAILCWCGTIFAGNITVMACNKVNFETLPENLDCVGYFTRRIDALGYVAAAMDGISLGMLYNVNNAFSAHRNIFNVFAEEMARYCRCIIQLDRMDSAGLLFRSSAVRNKNIF